MEIKTKNIVSAEEQSKHEAFIQLFNESTIPDNEKPANTVLFVKRQSLSKNLFFNEPYQRIVDAQGVIMEFGANYGQLSRFLSSIR